RDTLSCERSQLTPFFRASNVLQACLDWSARCMEGVRIRRRTRMMTPSNNTDAEKQSAVWGFLTRKVAVWSVASLVLMAPLNAGSKLARELERVDSQANVDVIVQYRDTPTSIHHERVHRLGGTFHRQLNVIGGAHYTVPASALEDLANDPDVESVHLDHAIKASTTNINTIDYGWMSVLGLNSPSAQ